MFITGLKILGSYIVASLIVGAIVTAIYFIVLYPWILGLVGGFAGVSLFAMVVHDWLWGKPTWLWGKPTEGGNG